MTTDNHRSTTLPDVDPTRTRTLKVTVAPHYTPENAIVTAIYRVRSTGEPIHYPVEVKRKDLLAALGAEPSKDLVEENERLGRELAKASSDRDAAERERDEARAAMAELAPAEVCVRGDYFKPSELPEVLGRVMDARDEAQREAKRYYLRAAEEAPEEPRKDQGQIDRSWALERAGAVISGLAAVGASPRLDSTIPIIELAWWIVNGPEGDRG